MVIKLTCLYCNHSWERFVKAPDSHIRPTCLKCKDTNIKVENSSKSKVDYYKDCPPFPEHKDDSDLLDWMLTGSVD